jgi:16S rRNA (cytosine1402-N4)-methyltransferase
VSTIHLPVMPQESLRALNLQPGQVVVDCTAGAGGHLALLCAAVAPSGRVIALDRDPRAQQEDAAGGVVAKHPHASLHARPFSEVEAALAEAGVSQVDALFADLGVSSMQLDDGTRGFSFRNDAALDMRMDPSTGMSAYEWLVAASEQEVADALYQYGEERQSRRLARVIKERVPTSTLQLAQLCERVLGRERGRIHPATRTFQALRIVVNGELNELETLLACLPKIIKRGGRVALLTFHSLEDRPVKVRFKEDDFEPLFKKPLPPTLIEIDSNPRSRSAKLRAATYVGPGGVVKTKRSWPKEAA